MRFLATPLVADSLWVGETVVPMAEAMLTDVQHVVSVYDVGLLV